MPVTEWRPDQVSWDRDGDTWIGVFYPGYLHILRTHVDGLRKLAVRRLEEHAAGGELGPLDVRLLSVIDTRRQSLRMHDESELELLIPIANRLAGLQASIPGDGGIVVLRTWDERYLWGTGALDVCQAINAWMLAWLRGELVDGMPCPADDVMAMWREQHDWLRREIAIPLSPLPGEGPGTVSLP